MSLKNVKDYFKKHQLEHRILEFDESSATVELAAKRLNSKTDEIAKTLAFKLKNNYILIVISGDEKIDNKKFKSIFKQKAKMVDINELEEKIGHYIGGICPFAVKENVDIYLDISLKKHIFIYPACGSSNSAIKLRIDELEKYSNYKEWIDIGKGEQDEI